MMPRLRAIAAAIVVGLASHAAPAGAQSRGGGGGRRAAPPPPRPQAPAPSNDSDEPPAPRTEPELAPPSDPLAIPPEVGARIGSDWNRGPPAPEGPLERRRWFPYYEERQGDFRLRLLPPFFVEQTRGLEHASQRLYGVPQSEDTQGLYGLLYYRRRSLKLDMDVVFPAVWRVRDGDSHTLVLGPFVHREAPGENDNWLAPLYFQGSRKDGGYFHSPLLLTTTHSSTEGAFTLIGPYFRNRSGREVNAGLVPFYFHGDNGSVDGNRSTYTLVPPLLFYHGDHEADGSSITVVGPVIAQSDPKRDVFDVAPFYFHIHGKPESGGVAEEHTTLFPFFHYGHTADRSLFILPGYLRQVTPNSDTMLSLFYSRVEGRGGATSVTAAGPIVPLWWDIRDRDLGVRTWALAPFFLSSNSPAEHDWLTPLVGRFETYGQSTTWWFFPSFTFQSGNHGWENDFHPLIYVGRSDDASHTVVAPIFWDFANSGGRTTIGFPVYWRFADAKDDSVVQVAGNTVYLQKRVVGGTDWQFHFAPLFSYGENPTGYFWNVLFGLAGYSRYANGGQVRAFWIPFDVGGAPAAAPAKAAER
ncbi:MAG: hypothetical protein FWD17_01125 [Polyangiaceae bacterium]|nr:hypothetical protein [Polyangiaceae bacterium]